MGFAVGDRVVVTENYRGAGCNHDMIGYYGHVVDEYAATKGMVLVTLIGRTNGEPIHPHRVGSIDRFAFYGFELEHAD